MTIPRGWVPGLACARQRRWAIGTRRRQLGVDRACTRIPGVVPGLTLRMARGVIVALPRARRWGELAEAKTSDWRGWSDPASAHERPHAVEPTGAEIFVPDPDEEPLEVAERDRGVLIAAQLEQ